MAVSSPDARSEITEMLAPVMCTRTDRSRGAAMLAVSGPLTDCDLAQSAIHEGIRLILVSESPDVRANLVLSDLDSLAPVVHNLAQVCQIVATAA